MGSDYQTDIIKARFVIRRRTVTLGGHRDLQKFKQMVHLLWVVHLALIVKFDNEKIRLAWSNPLANRRFVANLFVRAVFASNAAISDGLLKFERLFFLPFGSSLGRVFFFD